MRGSSKEIEETVIVTEEDVSAWRRTVGQNIKEYRESLGVSQEKLARALGLSVSAISKWEQGQNSPSPAYVLALSKIFECSPRDIFDGI
jgi:transcriptional regulator with XRE-family HTH domain